MKLIQIILLILISAMGYSLVQYFRGRKLFQLISGVVVATGVFFTLFFDASTYVANLLGIGRGADLILYVGITSLMLVCLLLYKRILVLEEKLVQMTREDSLRSLQEKEQL